MADTAASAEVTAPGPGYGEPKSAYGVPSFRAFWFNGLTFFLSANALRFVYGWIVLDGLGRGEAIQGLVVFLFGLPALVLTLPAGVWADRFDPKRLLIASQVVLMVVLIGTALAVGDGAGTLGLAIVSALLAGAASAIGGPVRQSLVPALLEPRLLYSGIAMNALAITLSLVLGAVAARQFGEWFGFDGAYWWMVVLLAVGIGALTFMQSPGPANTGDKTTLRQAIGEGLNFVWHNKAIRTLFFLLGLSGAIMSPIMMVTIQAHVKSELDRSAGDAAPILALIGLGIAISSVYILRQGNMADKGGKFMKAMMGGTTMVTLMGFSNAYWQLLVLGLLMGLCGGFFINMNQGLIQGNTPSEVMGRVMGLYGLAQTGLTPIGAVVLGALAQVFGTGPTISAAGALAFVCVVATYVKSTSIREID